MTTSADFVLERYPLNCFLDNTNNIELMRYEHVAVLRMSNGKTNALDKRFLKILYKTLVKVLADEMIEIIVLSSKLRFAFCTGLDLTEDIGIIKPEKIPQNLVRHCQMFFALNNLILNSSKPIIAAINGVSLGMGVQLAAACDFRISSELAWFNIPEMKIGGVFPTVPLVQQIGLKNIKRMLYNGEKIDAEEAVHIGLIDATVSDKSVEQEAIAYAIKIQFLDKLSLQHQKKLINRIICPMLYQEQRSISIIQQQLLRRKKVLDFLYELKNTGNILKMK